MSESKLNHNELKFSNQRRHDCEDVSFSVAVWFPVGEIPKYKESFRMPVGEKIIITWTISQFRRPDGKQYRKAIDHFSTLPFGWIPDHDIDFFKQFILRLGDKWLELCDLGEKHLNDCVSRILRIPLN
jgi:hypothetical protein